MNLKIITKKKKTFDIDRIDEFIAEHGEVVNKSDKKERSDAKEEVE